MGWGYEPACLTASVVVFGVGAGAARTLSYPGNVPTVLRDIEVEYAAQMVRKLDHCSVKLKVRRERAGTETNEETGMGACRNGWRT